MTGSLSDHPTQPNLGSTLDQPSPRINRQSEANRRNALRSTGPRTAAGKAVVRENALKHGFLSRHLIIEGESAEDFQQLLDELMAEYRHVGVVEYGSWEELVAQLLKLFDELIERQRIREMCLLVVESQSPPTQTDLLTRYQTTLNNDLYKALKALREAQAWRQARAALEASAVPAPAGIASAS